MLPELVGPHGAPFGLTADSADGPAEGAQLILVSDDSYTFSSLTGFGSRARLDTGTLRVATVSIDRTSEVHRLVALKAAGHPERYRGWRQWTTRNLEVRVRLRWPPPWTVRRAPREPAVRFRIRPDALRVRIALGQSGASPALLQRPVAVSTLVGVGRVMRGRPSRIVTHQTSGDA